MILSSVSLSNLVISGLGFYFIASMTWFFSTRREFFLRFFVPHEERERADKNMPKNRVFTKGLRGFAIAEFVIGTIFLLIASFLYLIKDSG